MQDTACGRAHRKDAGDGLKKGQAGRNCRTDRASWQWGCRGSDYGKIPADYRKHPEIIRRLCMPHGQKRTDGRYSGAVVRKRKCFPIWKNKGNSGGGYSVYEGASDCGLRLHTGHSGSGKVVPGRRKGISFVSAYGKRREQYVPFFVPVKRRTLFWRRRGAVYLRRRKDFTEYFRKTYPEKFPVLCLCVHGVRTGRHEMRHLHPGGGKRTGPVFQ